MKNLLLILIIAVPGIIYAKNIDLIELNYEWYIHNYKYIEKTLIDGKDKKVVPIVNTLGQIWIKRDGAIGAEVSPYIAKALIFQTKTMLIWFSANSKGFSEWVSNIEANLLTDYSGVRLAEIKKLRSDLLSSLNKYITNETDNELGRMAKIILTKLESSEVREID